MSHARTPAQLTRRGLLAAGGAVGLGAVLAACGDDKGGKKSSDTGAGAGGSFVFKDDRGTEVKADKIPANIVAFTGTAAALYDYGIQVKGVFGPTETADGKPDVQAGDLDISKVEILGNAWDKFSVEKYAALGADLLVTDMWIKDQGWYITGTAAEKKILQLKVPSAYLWAAETTMDKALARRVDLAAALGADVKDAKVTDAKAAFEKAAARLRAAVKANPGIKVLVGSGSADLFYASVPKMSADTRYFKELGVEFVEPKANAQGFFEELSWENVDKYEADVIMMDNRTGTLQPADLDKSKPTWKQLPAVKAGQVIPRVTEPIYSYAKCTPILDDLAKAIEDAKKVTK